MINSMWLKKVYRRISQPVFNLRNRFLSNYRFKKLVKQSPCRLVIGASGIFPNGWIPTEIDCLNLLKPQDWQRYFHDNSIDAMLAEHVWEHLTIEEGKFAATICFKYLKPGGYIRIAVPDGMHPDPSYLDWVRPNGMGPGADDHKVLYTYKTSQQVFETAGFKIDLLEYFDENGTFHYHEWDSDKGFIHRSSRFDERNSSGSLAYTSIILDAKKSLATLES